MALVAGIKQKNWTETELQALPDDGYQHEVVDGKLVLSPKNDFYHGRICMRLSAALHDYAAKNRLGIVLDSSTGFWMKNHNCRAPDISFVPKGRLEELGFKPSTRKFFPRAPDLAVEVLSPNNTRTEINARLKDFFSSGTKIAWIINPTTKSVEVCHSPDKKIPLDSEGSLDGEHLLPGFRYPIAALFKEWDWE
ncbi:MAG TPA: Uma2 family endonuclease [Candidatus Limnocylindrales bacterium]|jgi:Uma2 family endonuclease|nr:Uma2 family endonuclease [Candidatus Limnocylindrales bacterium]